MIGSKKVAVISPINCLDLFCTDMHMALTQYCLKSPQYKEFFRLKKQAGEFLLLDNGAAELKASISPKDVFECAVALEPTVVIAPDVIYDANQTVKGTLDFIEEYGWSLRKYGIGIMAVPQGRNFEEWFQCYKIFNDNDDIDWLGVSMFYTPKFGRLKALKAIEPTIRKPCHLLGIWSSPYDLVEEAKFDFVRSVDSAKPVEYAMENINMKQWDLHRHIDDDWYFLNKVQPSHKLIALAQANVRELRTIFEGGKS